MFIPLTIPLTTPLTVPLTICKHPPQLASPSTPLIFHLLFLFCPLSSYSHPFPFSTPLSPFAHLQDADKLHPGHGLFYEFHRNQGGNHDNVLLHALGQWRITPAFHDICFLPNIAVSKPLLIITHQVGILSNVFCLCLHV